MNLSAQDRALAVVATENLGPQATVGKQYALFIAIDNYRTWNALRFPVRDAREIRDILRRDYYIDEVIELYNQDATRANIARTFADLQTRLTVHDSLFIYYAGHGHLDESSGQGYWIPIDGGLDRFERQNWLPNNEILGYIGRLQTIHVFMANDSCFSGDMLERSAAPQIDNAFFRRAYGLTSRQVMTSGLLVQVPDQSEFSAALINSLRKNTEPLLSPNTIYGDMQLSVRDTFPQFGALRNANHQTGASFLFFRKPAATVVTPVPEGLEWKIADDGKGITITKYTGSAATVVIPSRIAGLPVTVIGGRAFFRCGRLTSISIPSSVTTIGSGAFEGCGRLTSISIPSSVTTIGIYAFEGCRSLTTISIPSSVTSIKSSAFSSCSSLTSIAVDSRNTAYTSRDGVLFNKNMQTIVAYPAGKTGTSYTIPSSVTSIELWAFNSCSLTSVSIPSSVTSIGDYAFSQCTSLTSVSIPSSVTSIEGGTFAHCSRLTSISIPSSVTSIGMDAFNNCSRLTSISIPSSVTSIGMSAFDGCPSLTSVTLSRHTQVGERAFPDTARITYRD